LATVQERLDAAEAAYHTLMLGQSARVVVDQNGERVEYTPANSTKLAAYINELKRQLGTIVVGPMNVFM